LLGGVGRDLVEGSEQRQRGERVENGRGTGRMEAGSRGLSWLRVFFLRQKGTLEKVFEWGLWGAAP
jgi:hypothetical protein